MQVVRDLSKEKKKTAIQEHIFILEAETECPETPQLLKDGGVAVLSYLNDKEFDKTGEKKMHQEQLSLEGRDSLQCVRLLTERVWFR